MKIVKETINLDQVVNIQLCDMTPVYYLKFFGGNIKVQTSCWKPKKLEERYYLYDVTDVTRLDSELIYDDKYDYIDERFLEENGYAIHRVKCKVYDKMYGNKCNYISFLFSDIRAEAALQLSKEYNNVEKIGIVCCERHIEADFNLIDKIKTFLKNDHQYANKYGDNDKLIDNSLIMQAEGDTYDFIVYAKPCLIFRMADGTEKMEYYETIEDAEREFDYFAEEYKNIKMLR